MSDADEPDDRRPLLEPATDYHSGLDLDANSSTNADDGTLLDERLTETFGSVVRGMLPLAAQIALGMSAW